ncbi:MAG: hypothetical protein MK137_08740 [Rickettsiales bacterium]|nr:hypothetical protein [Rickettsiales bacterium]
MMKNVAKISLIPLMTILLSAFSLFGSGWNDHVPEDLRASGSLNIIYKADGTHSFGPGGINEAFIVYELTDTAAQAIEQNGLDYLQDMRSTFTYQDLYATYEDKHKSMEPLSKEERKLRFAYMKSARGLYKDWMKTPVQEYDERWNRNRNKYYKRWIREGLSDEERWARYKGRYRGHDSSCKGTSLCSFYGDYKAIPLSFKHNDVLKNKTLEDLNFVDDIEQKYIELATEVITSPGSYYGYGELGAFLIAPKHKKAFLLYRD